MLLTSGFVTIVNLFSEHSPLCEIARGQIRTTEVVVLGDNCCNNAHRAAYNKTGRGLFPTCCPSFMIARGAKNVFEVIVGAWKISHIITVEQSRLIAHCYFEEGSGHLLKWDSQGNTLLHLLKQLLIPLLHLFLRKMIRFVDRFRRFTEIMKMT